MVTSRRGLLRWAGPLLVSQALLSSASAVAQTAKLAIAPTSAFLAPGGTGKFVATLTRADGTTQQVIGSSWASSNPAVATVDSSQTAAAGTTRALAAGTSAITVTARGGDGSLLSAQATLTVRDFSFAINPAAVAVSFKGGFRYQGVVTRPDGSTATIANTSARWTSSAPAVAAVDSTGAVTPATEGAATITATFTTADGRVRTATSALTVREPRLSLSQASLTMACPASPIALRAKLTRSDGSVVDVTPTWSSSNPAVATVGPYGGVTPAGAGRATVTAQFQTQDGVMRSASAAVDVWALALVVAAEVRIGTTIQARVNVTRPDGTRATMAQAALTGWQVVFESSNPSVLTIDSAGVVTGKGIGTAFVRFSGREPASGMAVSGSTYPPANATVSVASG